MTEYHGYKHLPKISSNFAVLDVKVGRGALNTMVGFDKVKPRIIIEAEIDGVWSDDDGVSREFSLDIKSMRWKP